MQGRPFLRKIDLLDFRFRGGGTGFSNLERKFFQRGCGSFRRGRDLRLEGLYSDLGDPRFGRNGRRGTCTCRQLRVAESRGPLEAAAQFTKTLGTTLVTPLAVDLLQLCGELRGTAVVAGAEDKVEQLFPRRRTPWGAAQNRFEETDRLLRKPVTGEEIDVGERLGDEFLCFLVERWLRCGSFGLRVHLGGGLLDGRPNFGGFRLRQFRRKRYFGNRRELLWFRFRRKKSELAQNAIEFALGGIALRLAVDELFENFFGALQLACGGKSITQLRESVGKAERIARAAVSIHEPLMGLDAAGHARGQFVQ